MNKTFYFIFLFFIFSSLAAPLITATCSLGASPLEMAAKAKPGQTVEIAWNFFNLRGDRATHVLINKASGPDWEISYSPEAQIKKYEVSGIIKDSNENFAMDKSIVTTTKPDGIYVVHPNSSEGYILIDKQMKIYITIPENEEIGKTENFVFEAIGKCFGEEGAVSASLATELKVNIKTSTEYYEKPYEEGVETETTTLNLGQKIGNLFNSTTQIQPLTMLLTGVTLTLVIVFVILAILFKRNKKEGKKIKK